MDFPKPYRLADRSARALNRKIAHRFDRTLNLLRHGSFDELNVFRHFEELYRNLGRDSEEAFRALYRSRYQEMYMYLKQSWPDEDELDELVEIYLSNLLTEPHPLTHYAFDSETLRKRDRAVEAVNSETAKNDKEFEFERAMRYWSQQNGFYLDIVSDDAALEAMKNCGVKKVRWMAEPDDKTCKTCDSLHGKVFDIDRVPEKPHINCRCWLVPVD